MSPSGKSVRRSGANTAAVVVGILALFIVVTIGVWLFWSANEDGPQSGDATAPVQQDRWPPETPVTSTSPGADPTGDAVARGVERDNTGGAPGAS